MSAKSARLERADRVLRQANPVPRDALAGTAETPAARATLRRILAGPPAGGSRRARRIVPRLARGAVGLIAAGALVALMGALFIVVRGGDEPATTSVPPPPIHYGIFDRPQTTDDVARAESWPERIAPESIRLAVSDAGDRYIFAKTPDGRIICRLETAQGGGYSMACGSGRPTAGYAGGEAVANRHLLLGTAPDAIVEVVVNGRSVPVVNNVFHVDLDPRTTRVVVDFRTAEGVVTAWHQENQIAMPPPRPAKEEAFGPQARLLQTRVPYLGVACPAANSFACDRVGLAVWLRKPARQVVAKIAGRRVVLDDPNWSGPATTGLRRKFAGFLQPAGLIDGSLRIATKDGGTRWTGRPPVSARVIITVTYRDGGVASAAMRVPLSPGWG